MRIALTGLLIVLAGLAGNAAAQRHIPVSDVAGLRSDKRGVTISDCMRSPAGARKPGPFLEKRRRSTG